jgi:hypothetical protein
MVVMTVMTALCTVGVAFYVRFLVALYKDCRHEGFAIWCFWSLTLLNR